MHRQTQIFCVISVVICVVVRFQGAETAPVSEVVKRASSADAVAPEALSLAVMEVAKRESEAEAAAPAAPSQPDAEVAKRDSEANAPSASVDVGGVERDSRRVRPYQNRRKKYFTSRRIYSRRHPVSHSSQSSSSDSSSSESVSDSDERSGRRLKSKSPARQFHVHVSRGHKTSTVHHHNNLLHQHSEYAYIPVRREDLKQLLHDAEAAALASHSAPAAPAAAPQEKVIILNAESLRHAESQQPAPVQPGAPPVVANEPVVRNNGSSIQIFVP